MAVYARGYRAYDGGFRAMPAAWAIFAEGIRMALARKGVRRILLFVALVFCVTSGVLYFQFGLQEKMQDVGGRFGLSLKQMVDLNRQLRWFHNISVILASLASVLVGAGLVADDLKTRALTLYLVRPLRPVEYALGKALVLPALLVPLALVPGFLLYVMVGLWQPPGETWAFLGDHADIGQRVLQYYVLAALSLSGLMLLLSSRSARRGAVIGLAAAVLFGGPFLRAIGAQVGGGLGEALRSLDVMNNATREFKLAGAWRYAREAMRQPGDAAPWVLAGLLFAAGLFATWRRARSVEVGE